MLRAQKMLPKLPPRLQRMVIRACGRKRFVDWAFDHYLRIAPPDFAGPAPLKSGDRQTLATAA
jgi:hypothetical protein